MSIGRSGRIVIEIEPEAKRQLYAALVRDGLTLKDWFLKSAATYLTDGNQLPFSCEKEKAVKTSEVTTDLSKTQSSTSKA